MSAAATLDWLRRPYLSEVGVEPCRTLAEAAAAQGLVEPRVEGLWVDVAVALAHVHEVVGGWSGVEYAALYGIVLEVQVQLWSVIEAGPLAPVSASFSSRGFREAFLAALPPAAAAELWTASEEVYEAVWPEERRRDEEWPTRAMLSAVAEELAWLGPAFGRCGEREIGATVEAVGGWLGEALAQVEERVATNARVERLRVEQMRLAQEGW